MVKKNRVENKKIFISSKNKREILNNLIEEYLLTKDDSKRKFLKEFILKNGIRNVDFVLLYIDKKKSFIK